MTPKEKAKQLYDRYCNMSSYCDDANECALIAVDELINLYEFENPHRGFKISYWDEVKTEIEKL